MHQYLQRSDLDLGGLNAPVSSKIRFRPWRPQCTSIFKDDLVGGLNAPVIRFRPWRPQCTSVFKDGGWNWSQLKLEDIFNFHCFVSQLQRNNSARCR